MDLYITSTDTIKPSPPTPQNLKTHKLSFLDQLSPAAYFSMILFYSGSSPAQSTTKTSEHLKKSLSETLTHFYPFAGQLKDDVLVDCNDHGVPFVEAHLAIDMSEVIKQNPDEELTNILQQLIPCKPHESINPKHNLMVQVIYFGCGGMAIAMCFNHKIGDAETALSFVKSWATFARGVTKGTNVNYDSNSIFPARELPDIMLINNLFAGLFSLSSVVKRFTFDGTKIASLVNGLCNLDRPSRFEAVSSVILSAVMAAYRESGDEFNTPTTNLVTFIPVNLRKRLNPPMPEQSFGNIYSSAVLNLEVGDEKKKSYTSLAGEVRRSVRKWYEEGETLNILRAVAAQGMSKSRGFVISSWCKMPFYEMDFGWGNPMNVVGTPSNEAAVLIDSCDGKGIEAWVRLPEQDMARFEQHPGILAYTCSI